jgi:preprotein translocase subunit SecA
MRREILAGESQEETVREWMEELLDGTVDTYCPEGSHPEDWDLTALGEAMHRQFDVRLPAAGETPAERGRDTLRGELWEAVQARYAAREREVGPEILRHLERWVMLQIIDTQWKDHLLSMDHLKEGIGLRGYGQRDPLTEYKREAFDLFEDMVGRVRTTVVEWLFKLQVAREAPPDGRPAPTPASPDRTPRPVPRPEVALTYGAPERRVEAARGGPRVGRNEPCPCGSGKKYKKCCLAKNG